MTLSEWEKHYLLSGTTLFSLSSSMYFDEDGDLAHEFYEEEEVVLPPGGGRGGGGGGGGERRRREMRRVSHRRLTPQGEVPYTHPRLHVDFPIIMYQG